MNIILHKQKYSLFVNLAPAMLFLSILSGYCQDNAQKSSKDIDAFVDVECIRIIRPVGEIESTAIVTPSCLVHNRGSENVSYTVRMKIGTFYNQTVQVLDHISDSFRLVTFPACSIWVIRGTYIVSCSTELTKDQNTNNDKQIDSIKIIVEDVGCTDIYAPTDTVDSTQLVVPSVRVYNYGNITASFNVRMIIGSFYNKIVAVSSLAPRNNHPVNFPAYSNWPIGTHIVTCSTEFTTDMNRSNNKKIGSVTVRRISADTINFMSFPKGSDYVLQFSLYQSNRVSLKIRNVSGEIIKNIPSHILPAGVQQIIWNCRDSNGNRVAFGVYLVELNIGQKTYRKRIAILPIKENY
ncbi:MAG: FlgD immunoglobulin-like domain containing protein [candidate division WOR-3 bacterium]